MQAFTFWKTITLDRANMIEKMTALLNEHGIQYCVIGGQAVNAYVEPLVSLDLDLAVAVDQIDQVEQLLQHDFSVRRFPHRLNVSLPGSDLRVQIQTDPRYGEFVQRSRRLEVLGLEMPVAGLEDVLRGKIWAVQDPERRASKRQKDLADIARILEKYPAFIEMVPEDITKRLEE